MKRIIPWIFISILIGGVFWNRTHISQGEDQRVLDLRTVQGVFPQASKIEHHLTPFSYYSVYGTDPETGKRALTGYAFLTSEIAPEIKGYIGPIVILVGIDLSGKIQKLKVLEHHETSSYATGITQNWWLKQFVGLGPKSNFSLSPEGPIDAISSATVSSLAVCRSVQGSLQEMAGKVLTQEKVHRKTFILTGTLNLYEISFIVILFILSSIAYLRLWRRMRWVLLAIGFGYLGVKLKLLLSVVHLSSFLQGGLPSFELASFLWVFLGLILITGLLFGRIYCGFLCPFGAVQEFLYKILPWCVEVRPSWDGRMKKPKYYLLWLLLVASLFYPPLRGVNYEPFALTFTLKGPFLVWCFACLVLLFSLFIERFYCRYFCFAGAFLGLLNKLSLTRLRFGENCKKCRSCEELCQTQAIEGSGLDPVECILCNRCRSGCPDANIRPAIRPKPTPGVG